MTLVIDGRLGEGGGQVLRTTLALSVATGKAVHLSHIRAGRSKPGLRPQHLASVRAAAAVGDAVVEGAARGSMDLAFTPRGLVPGRHEIEVGTAGSATLVLQTVLPPLLTAPAPSTLVVEGGTHNPMAPPHEFLARVYLPAIERLGPRLAPVLVRHGFAPAGGGRIELAVTPVPSLAPLTLLDRGHVTTRRARILLAGLPLHVAEREAQTIRKRLGWTSRDIAIDLLDGGIGPGNAVLLEALSEHAAELVTGFGQEGVSAERVADRACREMTRWLRATVPVGEHLADQLLLPLALGAGGRFRTLPLSSHALTQIELIGHFLDVAIRTEEVGDEKVEVTVVV